MYYPNGKDCRWARLRGEWKERCPNLSFKTHVVALTLNKQTGDLYLDCSEKKIWTKCLTLTFLSPCKGLIRTAFHLALPLSIPVIIATTLLLPNKKDRMWKEIPQEILLNCGKSIADIFRVPFYTAMLTAVAIFAVVVGPFKEAYLYDLRCLIGKIDRAMNRGQPSIPCFSPYGNIDDTLPNEFLDSVDRFVERRINFLKYYPEACGNYLIPLGENTTYLSPAYVQWQSTQTQIA